MHCYLLREGPCQSSEGYFVTIELLLAGICRHATLRTRQVICAVHGFCSLATISSDVSITYVVWRSCPDDVS